MFLNNNENNMFKQILQQMTNTLISEDSDALEFSNLIEAKNYDKAYTLVMPSIKETLDINEFKQLMNINSIPSDTPDDSAIKNFQESQKIYKDIALKFSKLLVNNDFTDAYKMLSISLKKDYTPELLEKKLKDMTDYFEGNILTVATKFVEEEGAMDDQYIYVPIEEPGNGEAISLFIAKENEILCINEIEWGRP